MGLSQDTLLTHFYAYERHLRVADGPDEVHRNAIAKQELAAYLLRVGMRVGTAVGGPRGRRGAAPRRPRPARRVGRYSGPGALFTRPG